MSRLLTPLTALCAALAVWSLVLFGIALLGLGAGFGPHPADFSLAPPMPESRLAGIHNRLGPATDYLEVGQRPLLTPDRRPAPGGDGGAEAASAPLVAQLTGVILSGAVRIALLQDSDTGRSRRVREGEVLEGTAWLLQSLAPRRAVFVGPEGEMVLDLRVFDGKGGAAPTPSGTAADAPVAAMEAATTTQAGPGGAPVAPAPASAGDEATTQQAQVDAIRQRIEARRAAMRAEQAKNAAERVD